MAVTSPTSPATTQITDGNGDSSSPTISGDGGHVTFDSRASDLVQGDDNYNSDVFVWDSTAGTTTRLTDGNGESWNATISADGGLIAFTSRASDLVPGDYNEATDVFLWRRSIS